MVKMEENDFINWLLAQAVGYDTWDRKEEKLYALPLWIATKRAEYQKMRLNNP